MSKAFVKEGDSQDDDPEESDPLQGIPKGTKNYMTPGGADQLRMELKRLLHEDRPKLVETISWAASNGDRSENGDYIYGKRRLREIDRRIRFLTKRLESAEIVDPLEQSKSPSKTIRFGATVTVCDEEEKKITYQIVGIDEANPKLGKISWISPVAKSLLGAQSGDSVIVRTPQGEVELEVLEIIYQEIK